jgi:hypothetical protein
MKALLRGGPCEGRIIADVTESTQNIAIPAASMTNPRSAIYTRVGENADARGEKTLLFNFVKVQQQKLVEGLN